MKGGRNQEGYADPTATIAVGRVTKEQKEQAECEAADKRVYDLIKVLKYLQVHLIGEMVSTNKTMGAGSNEFQQKKIQRMKDRQDRKVRLRNYGK